MRVVVALLQGVAAERLMRVIAHLPSAWAADSG